MPVDTRHKQYAFREEDWLAVRDTVEGETMVKARRDHYLPIPPGMAEVGGGEVLESGKRTGNERYTFYLSFGEFPELISTTINGFQGLVHTNEPIIELPEKMEYLLEEATPGGDSLKELWEKMTREIISTGRYVLLTEVRAEDDALLVAPYTAESLINWHLRSKQKGGDPDLVVLREISEKVSKDDDFVMEEETTYRELRLTGGKDKLTYSLRKWTQKKKRGEFIEDEWVTPEYFGKPFESIPIVVANVHEIGFQYSPVPVLPLVRRALAIYRKSADYNRALYIKSDPQPWISGCLPEHAPDKIGGDIVWTFPNPQARAQYLDIDGKGLPLLQQAIKDEYERFYKEGGKLMEAGDRGPESGEALRRRQTSQQVSLRSIAFNAGVCMQFQLRQMAEIMGEDPEKVRFEADLNFAEPTLDGQQLLFIMQAKVLGAPYSDQSIHDKMVRGGMTNKSYEEERSALSSEPSKVDGVPKGESTEIETGPPEPPEEEDEDKDKDEK